MKKFNKFKSETISLYLTKFFYEYLITLKPGVPNLYFEEDIKGTFILTRHSPEKYIDSDYIKFVINDRTFHLPITCKHSILEKKVLKRIKPVICSFVSIERIDLLGVKINAFI